MSHIRSSDQLATGDITMSDYKKLLELLPPTSPDVVSIRRTLATLPTRVESAQKRETAEMLDKLKGLGNSLLGDFRSCFSACQCSHVGIFRKLWSFN